MTKINQRDIPSKTKKEERNILFAIKGPQTKVSMKTEGNIKLITHGNNAGVLQRLSWGRQLLTPHTWAYSGARLARIWCIPSRAWEELRRSLHFTGGWRIQVRRDIVIEHTI